jgi:hypothetical protein
VKKDRKPSPPPRGDRIERECRQAENTEMATDSYVENQGGGRGGSIISKESNEAA